MTRPAQLVATVVATGSLAALTGCLALRAAGEAESKYESCVHHAFQPVSAGWVCSADGQILGASFDGHVVTQDGTGRLVPLSDVQFTRAYVSPAGAVALEERLDVSVSADGWFSIPQPVGFVVALQKKNGQFVATESLHDYLFTIHAEGCEDYLVHFRPDDPDRVIIMKCEARAIPPTSGTR